MLATLETYAVLPAKDLQRARQFYKEKLGLEPAAEDEGKLVYKSASGATFSIYETGNAGTAQNTAMGWSVKDLEAEVADLRSRGIVFEEYDLPGLKTVNGITAQGNEKAAWFKDSEGNILCLSQTS
ncbi:MAG TPA: VOC family protein [Candidatus Saccharimonadales bacterium]|nr:VOC family protein [Candidatus Saccharimonadales bacterium]